jgi:hypothetical protein
MELTGNFQIFRLRDALDLARLLLFRRCGMAICFGVRAEPSV